MQLEWNIPCRTARQKSTDRGNLIQYLDSTPQIQLKLVLKSQVPIYFSLIDLCIKWIAVCKLYHFSLNFKQQFDKILRCFHKIIIYHLKMKLIHKNKNLLISFQLIKMNDICYFKRYFEIALQPQLTQFVLLLFAFIFIIIFK